MQITIATSTGKSSLIRHTYDKYGVIYVVSKLIIVML